jgi:3-oxoacyl-[acyl-carrier protein] reductase
MTAAGGSLEGRVAFVTGAARGQGRAHAVRLAQEGADIIATDICGPVADSITYKPATSAELAETVGAIEATGRKVLAREVDIRDLAAQQQLVADGIEQFGRLDILVANAGVAADNLLLRVKEEEIDRVFAVNLKGAIASARAATKVMMRARTGRVIFLSSVVGEMGNAGQAVYAASKAALLGLTKTLAREYASRNITVNAVAPGFIDTDMTTGITGDMKVKMLESIPLGRTGRPEEIAAAIVFLCADEAGYITGQTLRVNGGMYV